MPREDEGPDAPAELPWATWIVLVFHHQGQYQGGEPTERAIGWTVLMTDVPRKCLPAPALLDKANGGPGMERLLWAVASGGAGFGGV